MRAFRAWLAGLSLLTTGACSHQVASLKSDWRQDWRERFDAGKEAHVRGDAAAAEQEFRAALEVVRVESPPGLATALSLNALAKLWIDAGRLEEADPALAESMKIFESRVGTENEHFAILLTNRGDLEMKEERYTDAEADFQRALQIAEQLKPVPEDLRTRARTMLVGSLCLQGRLEDGDAVGKQFGMKCRREPAAAP